MNTGLIESKRALISSLVTKIRKRDTKVLVSNYSYDCFFSGKCLTKTVIIIPEELDSLGILSIDKPLDQVSSVDVLTLYKQLKR